MKLTEELNKAVVFIGFDNFVSGKLKDDIFIGTGFLLNISNFFYVCTAKHVIYDFKKREIKKNLWAAVRKKTGKYQKVYFDVIREKYKTDWIFHKVKKYDISLLPIELNINDTDFKLIPKDLFFDSTQSKPSELLQVFFCSYQPGVEKVKDISPVIRSGFIARVNKDHTMIIDANTFPGNSGSPLFVAPTVGLVRDEGPQIGNPLSGKFLGVVTSYIPYNDIADSRQTGKPRIIFEENTGLATIHTHEILGEILNSKALKDQIKYLGEIKNGS